MALNKRFASALLAVGMLALPNTSYAMSGGEKAMEQLGICLATKGKNQCQAPAKNACTAIFNSAFTNGASSRAAITDWNNNGKPARWKQLTANLALKQAGFGNKFCYNVS